MSVTDGLVLQADLGKRDANAAYSALGRMEEARGVAAEVLVEAGLPE